MSPIKIHGLSDEEYGGDSDRQSLAVGWLENDWIGDGIAMSAAVTATAVVMSDLKMKVLMKRSCVSGQTDRRWLAGAEIWFEQQQHDGNRL